MRLQKTLAVTWANTRPRLAPPRTCCKTHWKSYATRGGEGEKERGVRGLQWFGIPAGLGIACLAALQLQRTVRRERRGGGGEGAREGEDFSWQLAAFQLLPARLLSRGWGRVMEREIPAWLRSPLLGVYVRVFGCRMEEAVQQELAEYESFSALFTRQLRAGTRPVSTDSLVCPCDGKVLHLGKVDRRGRLEQIKGVSYQLHHFLGQQVDPASSSHHHRSSSSSSPAPATSLQQSTSDDQPADEAEMESPASVKGEGGEVGVVYSTEAERQGDSELYHVTIYLAPGDYHGFHSPASWEAHTRRHFPGELLTVAPWAVKTMPGLFTLNERVLLLGRWDHGFFSFAAVGAYNVGSIALNVDKELKTNQKGRYVMGQFSDKQLLRGGEGGVRLGKGQRLGTFQMGSSIVLVFEAPKEFEFCVNPGDSVRYGQPLGNMRHT